MGADPPPDQIRIGLPSAAALRRASQRLVPQSISRQRDSPGPGLMSRWRRSKLPAESSSARSGETAHEARMARETKAHRCNMESPQFLEQHQRAPAALIVPLAPGRRQVVRRARPEPALLLEEVER